MTVNQPNHKFEVKIDETGLGKLIIKGVHWLQIEMMRIVDGPLHHVFAQPHKIAGVEAQDHAEVHVFGNPGETGTVEFHATNENISLVGPQVAGDSDKDLNSLTRDELNTHAAGIGVEDPDKLPNKDAVVEAINATKDPAPAPATPASVSVTLTSDGDGKATQLIEPPTVPEKVTISECSDGTATVGNEDGGACIWVEGAKPNEEVTVSYVVAE